MPRRINPDPEWHETLEVPIDGESIDAHDVALPFDELLSNDKDLRRDIDRLFAELNTMRRGQRGLSMIVPTPRTFEPGRNYFLGTAVRVEKTGGEWEGPVNLTALDVPPGMTVTFSPDSGAGATLVSDVNVNVSGGVTPGVYNIVIRAEAAGVSQQALWPLTIPAATLASSFAVSGPTSMAVERANSPSASATFRLSRTGGFSDHINLSVIGLPGGVQFAFTPSATLAGNAFEQAFTLSLTAADAVPAGVYNLSIRASGGSTVRTHSVALTVTGHPGTPSPPPVDVPPGQPVPTLGDFSLNVVYDTLAPVNGATVHINRAPGFTGPVWVIPQGGSGQVMTINGLRSSACPPSPIRVDGNSFRVVGINGTRVVEFSGPDDWAAVGMGVVASNQSHFPTFAWGMGCFGMDEALRQGLTMRTAYIAGAQAHASF